MAFENLLKSVEESAEDRQRDLKRKAEQQAEGIQAQSKKQAAEIEETAIRESERSAAAERNRMLYLAKGEITAASLVQREALFQEAVSRARVQLARIREDTEYPAIFERLCREAAMAMGPQRFIARVDPRDLELARKTMGRLGIRCEIQPDLDCAGGIVVGSPDGLVVLDNTVESRLARAEDLKKLEIHAILSGG